MATNTRSPLLHILREMGVGAMRDEFAARAGTTSNYLYQLGSCQRGACRADLAKRISDASKVMNKRYGTPTITMEQLATMCPIREPK